MLPLELPPRKYYCRICMIAARSIILSKRPGLWGREAMRHSKLKCRRLNLALIARAILTADIDGSQALYTVGNDPEEMMISCRSLSQFFRDQCFHWLTARTTPI